MVSQLPERPQLVPLTGRAPHGRPRRRPRRWPPSCRRRSASRPAPWAGRRPARPARRAARRRRAWSAGSTRQWSGSISGMPPTGAATTPVPCTRPSRTAYGQFSQTDSVASTSACARASVASTYPGSVTRSARLGVRDLPAQLALERPGAGQHERRLRMVAREQGERRDQVGQPLLGRQPGEAEDAQPGRRLGRVRHGVDAVGDHPDVLPRVPLGAHGAAGRLGDRDDAVEAPQSPLVHPGHQRRLGPVAVVDPVVRGDAVLGGHQGDVRAARPRRRRCRRTTGGSARPPAGAGRSCAAASGCWRAGRGRGRRASR